MSLSLDALFKLTAQREAEEAAKPLEQRRREYRERHGAQWENSEQGKLCKEFYRAYTAYKEHIRIYTRDWREGNDTPVEFEEHQAYQEMARAMTEYQKQREETDKRNLEKAKLAARCTHRRAGGEYCGSPRMKGSKYCYGHDRLMAARTQDLELPPLEDANAIVLSLTKGLNAMMKGQMDLKSAGMFFYGMQIVASVMGRVRFGEPEER
ncbi:MAG TPA: hypothetical protein VGK24_12270 [Candidatus Angelobacter sp.]|jgi:hypothetical protein